MAFFKERYDALHYGIVKREALNVQYIWNETLPDDPSLWLDYEATEAALQINRERIQERMPLKGEIYTASSKERSKIKEFSLMKGSENIKKGEHRSPYELFNLSI